MRFALLLALVPILAGGGCSRSTEHSPAASTGQADPLADLRLDDGKRWPSDDHTRKLTAAMTAAVQAAAGDVTPAATTALGKRLQELSTELISGCTMQGPAHEALHVYLHALLPAVQDMQDADAAAALAARRATAAILARFRDYFA